MQQVNASAVSLLIRGEVGTRYLIQTTTNLGDPSSWIPAYDLVLTNRVHSLNWTNASESARFFRALDLR